MLTKKELEDYFRRDIQVINDEENNGQTIISLEAEELCNLLLMEMIHNNMVLVDVQIEQEYEDEETEFHPNVNIYRFKGGLI